MDFLHSLLTELNNEPQVTFIDVGCHKAHFFDEVLQVIPRSKIFAVGIDPLQFPESNKYNVYLQVAISNVEPGTKRSFYVYQEPGCSSLLPMKTDIVTHNIREKHDKWFVGWAIERCVEQREIEVKTLQSICEENHITGPIHLVKVDGQGSDLDIVLSLGDYIKEVKYVILECAAHDKVTLYENQPKEPEVISTMDGLGFDVVARQYYGDTASPESNVLFRNRKWM